MERSSKVQGLGTLFRVCGLGFRISSVTFTVQAWKLQLHQDYINIGLEMDVPTVGDAHLGSDGSSFGESPVQSTECPGPLQV